jgi:hypothetical protein
MDDEEPYYVEWKPDDLVVTKEECLAHYDGGIAVRLAPGAIGRLVSDISGVFYGCWLVSFSGNNYWVAAKYLKKIEVLDALAEFGK